jgi:hypothetical protein
LLIHAVAGRQGQSHLTLIPFESRFTSIDSLQNPVAMAFANSQPNDSIRVLIDENADALRCTNHRTNQAQLRLRWGFWFGWCRRRRDRVGYGRRPP